MSSSFPDDEAARVAALHRYDILDTPTEQSFDDLTRLAALVCGAPVALITFIEEDRQQFKSTFGVTLSETCREDSFCNHTILQNELLIVSDATGDARFTTLPFVANAPHVRFYAGMPLTTPEGQALGSLCVLDFTPRTLTPEQAEALRALTRQVMVQLELRRALTERARAERVLRERDTQLRLITDSVPALIVYVDREQRYRFNNKTYEEWFGRSRESVEGKHVKEALGDVAYEILRPRIETALRGEQVNYEATVPYPDGNARHTSGSLVPDIDEAGNVKGFIGLINDITQLKRTEAELRAASRLKDEFLATVSHELRTPLTSIIGWAHLLRSGNLDADAATRALETIERNGRAQSQLIEDLLDVSRIITGKLRLDVRRTELAVLIEAAADSLRPAAESKGVQLQALLDPQANPVSGDPDRLQQVIWNLLSNAVKFTPRGGRVSVRLEQADSYVRVAVSDTGQGIAAEFLPHVFDRFRQADQTTTRTHGGLGLGLAIARHLIELHGGIIEATSDGEAQGTTFAITLPVMSSHIEPAPVERRAPSPDEP